MQGSVCAPLHGASDGRPLLPNPVRPSSYSPGIYLSVSLSPYAAPQRQDMSLNREPTSPSQPLLPCSAGVSRLCPGELGLKTGPEQMAGDLGSVCPAGGTIARAGQIWVSNSSSIDLG